MRRRYHDPRSAPKKSLGIFLNFLAIFPCGLGLPIGEISTSGDPRLGFPIFGFWELAIGEMGVGGNPRGNPFNPMVNSPNFHKSGLRASKWKNFLSEPA